MIFLGLMLGGEVFSEKSEEVNCLSNLLELPVNSSIKKCDGNHQNCHRYLYLCPDPDKNYYEVKECIKEIYSHATPHEKENYKKCRASQKDISDNEVDNGRRIIMSSDLKEERLIKYDFVSNHLIDLEYIDTFEGETGTRVKSHFGFIAREGDDIIISIRGMLSFNDLKTDLAFFKLDAEKIGIKGKLHRGFYHHGKSIFENLMTKNIFKTLPQDPVNKIRIYGFSAGGAAAQVVGVLMKKKYPKAVIKIYSYGSPRVFDKKAANAFDDLIGVENHIRVMQKSKSGTFNRRDLITKLPPRSLGFTHAGTLCLIYPTFRSTL